MKSVCYSKDVKYKRMGNSLLRIITSSLCYEVLLAPLCTHMHTHVDAQAHTHTHTHTHTQMHKHTHTCRHRRTHTHTSTIIHEHVQYTHTFALPSQIDKTHPSMAPCFPTSTVFSTYEHFSYGSGTYPLTQEHNGSFSKQLCGRLH